MDDAEPPHKLFQQSGWQDTFIHLYSFSKAFSLTGHRVGAIVAGGDLLSQACKIQDCVAINAPHLGQVAAQFGLENLVEWKRGNGRKMIERAAAIKKAFEHPDLKYRIVSAGAYFAYVQHPFDVPSRSVAERLAREFKIVCLPGTYFGDGQESYFRFAFSGVANEQFPQLVSRLISSQLLEPAS
jgi:aspartate/methionine/tyrosine aminotransferase